jgi:transposase
MQTVTDRPVAPTAARNDLGAIFFVSVELSRSTWLITLLSPGSGEKMSKHSVLRQQMSANCQTSAPALLQEKARARTVANFPIVVIQEAGLDGFWIHHVKNAEIQSYVVDPVSSEFPIDAAVVAGAA